MANDKTYSYTEDQLLQLSALQHLLFCERQCALIHVEQAWNENRLTVEGRILHERVHDGDSETRGDVHVARGVHLRSLILGVSGIADMVEFYKSETGVALPGRKGLWMPFPVEYKRGKPKPDDCDLVQLCAQTLCLEEMLNVRIEKGAVFYGQPRRRMEVEFSQDLRDKTRKTAERLHQLIDSGITPPAAFEKKCKACSLFSLCMPENRKSAVKYLERMLEEIP